MKKEMKDKEKQESKFDKALRLADENSVDATKTYCSHEYKMFRDHRPIAKGRLTFYCTKCLKMVIKNKPETYEEI